MLDANTVLVHTTAVLQNITLSADKLLIEQARERARTEHKSLNTIFREWLQTYVRVSRDKRHYGRLMQRLRYVKPGRDFTRDEANER